MNTVILIMNGKATIYETDLACESAADKVEATKAAIHKTGEHDLAEVDKHYDCDYTAPERRDYLKYFPLAIQAINDAFTHNEDKHGKGINLSLWNFEANKARRHSEQSLYYPRNDEDGCWHSTSAACRALKALEAWITDNGQYVPPAEPEQQYRALGADEILQEGDQFRDASGVWHGTTFGGGNPIKRAGVGEYRRPIKPHTLKATMDRLHATKSTLERLQDEPGHFTG